MEEKKKREREADLVHERAERKKKSMRKGYKRDRKRKKKRGGQGNREN